MGKIWRLSKLAVFIEVGKNMFIVTFATGIDKQRVVVGKLWLFDSNLFALQDLDVASQLVKILINNKSFWVQLHNLSF